ncbi:D-2-hydroxyacid dehydrogenase family protein [Roseomonas sp. NAR14]|uniref:D-2-hydroxyacid dehydrogenase family protein n=1 Tax=Roseomonas acroporae TaxID=2937791 RepID=A0A9X1Y5D0_9PROT|nr:D-2-hydroxyacid dehydrogenase family protein [Roseomonas acroporae]MCK8783355.1 D-2-hydroxyacid dehydrogenase family protein [Roseomonas acroporae]
MQIAILDDYQDAFRQLDAAKRLAGHQVTVFHDTPPDAAALAERLEPFDAIVLLQQRTALSRAVIERLPNLRFISQTGRNLGHLDVAALTERGIPVSAGGSGGPHPTAELAWGLILAALRHIPSEVDRLKGGQWQGSVGTGLHGRTLGIYAFGRIGSLVAAVGRAFGMRVLCWGREGSLARAREAGYEAAASREEFFAAADVLSLHILSTPETRGIVTAADLARMKPDALLVNTSRATIIEPGALVAALQAGRPGHAAVDVFAQEPVLGAADPLLHLPNALCTPHLGYVEWGTLRSLYDAAVAQLLAYAAGAPINVANPAALPQRG